MASNNAIKTYKVVLVGSTAAGKTFLARKLMNIIKIDEKAKERYIATLGVEVHPCLVETNHGTVQLNIWDCAGKEEFGGLRDGYYIKGNVGVVLRRKNKGNEVIDFYDAITNVVGKDKTIVFDVADVNPKRNNDCNSSRVDLNKEEDVFKILKLATGFEDIKVREILSKC
jgi:GTPase SAR1 family protein